MNCTIFRLTGPITTFEKESQIINGTMSPEPITPMPRRVPIQLPVDSFDRDDPFIQAYVDHLTRDIGTAADPATKATRVGHYYLALMHVLNALDVHDIRRAPHLILRLRSTDYEVCATKWTHTTLMKTDSAAHPTLGYA